MKLDYKKTIYVGLAFMIISLFWQVYDTVIAKMVINSFGLNQLESGIVLAIDNVLALFLLPIFGALSDKTKSKYGRRTPYILYGVIASSILFTGIAIFDSLQQNLVALNNIPVIVKETVGGVDQYLFNGSIYATNELAMLARGDLILALTKANPGFLIGFLVILFMVLLIMSLFRTPAVSLMPDVTAKPLRSKANAIINLMGSAGGIIALGIMSFLSKDYQSYIPLFVVIAVIMLVLLIIFMLKVKEPKLVEEMEIESAKYGLIEKVETIEEMVSDVKKDKMPKEVKMSFIFLMLSIFLWFMAYNAATSKFSTYAQGVLDMGYTLPLLVAQGVAIISFIPIGKIASNIGRKKTILIGIVMLTTAFLLGVLATTQTTFLIYFTMGLAGMGFATINVNSLPMVVEMSKGSNVGKYTGYYYTASMAAQIITPIFSGALMDAIGMRVLFVYSVVFCAFAFITMSLVKHGDSKPIPVKTLEAYDAMD